MIGRAKPYTDKGIARVPCIKCGAPSHHQWRICSTGKWHPVCVPCDVEINAMVARWAFGPEAEPIIARYKRRVNVSS